MEIKCEKGQVYWFVIGKKIIGTGILAASFKSEKRYIKYRKKLEDLASRHGRTLFVAYGYGEANSIVPMLAQMNGMKAEQQVSLKHFVYSLSTTE